MLQRFLARFLVQAGTCVIMSETRNGITPFTRTGSNLVRMDHDSSENLIGGREKLEMTTCLLGHFLGNKHLQLRTYWYSVAPRGGGGLMYFLGDEIRNPIF